MRILPGVLKELMKHVPTVLFKTVEWGELAAELPKISKRVLSGEGREAIFESQKNFLQTLGIHFEYDALKGKDASEDNQKMGDQILRLFFAQLLSPHGLFLDLRRSHFSYQNSQLHWHPSSLWTQFSEEFRVGLIKVYDGFYLGKEGLFTEGLEGIGLLSRNWPQADQEKLCALFKSQFGNGQESAMTFDLDEFQRSMIGLAEFLLEKKVRISKDFLYLGINLVTLYSTLESLGTSHEVAGTYQEIRKEFSL